MEKRSQVAQMAIDILDGNPDTYDLNTAEDKLRKLVLNEMGGTWDYYTFQDNKYKVFAILSEILTESTSRVLREVFEPFCEFRDFELGDTVEFTVEDDRLFEVSVVATDNNNLLRQKLMNRKVPMTASELGVKIFAPFTAWLAGRIDLAKAEAVINLINAKSEKETKASINQLEGNLSLEIKKIKKMILSLLADIEASIDYPEYDEAEEVSNNKALTKLDEIQKELEKLNKSFETGKIIKDGIKVAIIGKPNSGKSSLLNAILKEDRAIVTDIEGTTRDTIEEFVTIDGIPFKFVDTAGIRKADNKVEEIGIEKSKKVAKESDLIIAMFDNSKKLTKEDEEILDFIKDKTAIIILNKIDLKEKNLEQEERITKSGKDVIKISLLSNCDLSGFYKELNMLFELNKINPDNEIIITEMRHKKLIEDAISHTENAKKTILDNIPIDIISINIKEIIEDLSKITGENVTEDVIKEIFSKFCLGK